MRVEMKIMLSQNFRLFQLNSESHNLRDDQPRVQGDLDVNSFKHTHINFQYHSITTSTSGGLHEHHKESSVLFQFSQWTGGCLQLQVGPPKTQILLYWYICIFICGIYSIFVFVCFWFVKDALDKTTKKILVSIKTRLNWKYSKQHWVTFYLGELVFKRNLRCQCLWNYFSCFSQTTASQGGTRTPRCGSSDL